MTVAARAEVPGHTGAVLGRALELLELELELAEVAGRLRREAHSRGAAAI